MRKEGMHRRQVGDRVHVWLVEDLWRLSASLPVEELDPASIIDLDRDGWFAGQIPTPRLILDHMKRILDADLSHPVILGADGMIMDGAHRVCKAILQGERSIRVCRFAEMPAPSRVE